MALHGPIQRFLCAMPTAGERIAALETEVAALRDAIATLGRDSIPGALAAIAGGQAHMAHALREAADGRAHVARAARLRAQAAQRADRA